MNLAIFAQFIHQVRAAMVVTDPEGVVLSLNAEAESLLGVVPGSNRGVRFSSWLDPAEQAKFESALARPSWPGSQEGEWWHTLIPGPARRLRYQVDQVLFQPGPVAALVVVCQDATREQCLLKALKQAQRAQGLGILARGVAHEFNNVFTGVISQLDLVRGSPALPPTLRENVQRAETAGRRGAELIQKLRRFSANAEPEAAPLDVAELLEPLLYLLNKMSDRRLRITLTQVTPEVWPVQADGQSLMLAVLNLCLHARAAMPNGGDLRVQIENANFLGLNAKPPRQAGAFVKITVEHTGPALAPGLLARLFDPAALLEVSAVDPSLGLFLAGELVRSLGGWIEAESGTGMGSSFCLFLPRTDASVSTRAPGDASAAAPESLSLDGTETLLVAEDDELPRTVMQASLTYRGYKVVLARDGAEAVQKYCVATPRPDLVILDLNLPCLDGWEVIARIREQDPGARFILLSGEVDAQTERTARGLGIGCVLQKPFENLELARAVRQACSRPASAAPS